MAWVRIHDGAMTHPKVIGLSDKAFRLWVWGLSYAQQHLTDGVLTQEAVPGRLKRGVNDLVSRRLWDKNATGFVIHDYLDWNDSREVVNKKKAGAKRRLDDWRDAQNALRSGPLKRVSDQTSETPLARSGLVISNSSIDKKKENDFSDARSKRPIYSGQRLVVFEWMLSDIMRMLGPHIDKFDIDEWWHTLDARAVKTGQVIPQRDGGKWLLAQTLAEAQRRGLPIASAPAVGKPESHGRVIPGVAETAAYLKSLRAPQ